MEVARSAGFSFGPRQPELRASPRAAREQLKSEQWSSRKRAKEKKTALGAGLPTSPMVRHPFPQRLIPHRYTALRPDRALYLSVG